MILRHCRAVNSFFHIRCSLCNCCSFISCSVDWDWRCGDNPCLCPILPGVEVCTQGRTELPRVETAELSWPEALVVPGAEHTAHDGPGRAVHTESRLSGKRGWEFQDGPSGQRGQFVNHADVHTGGRKCFQKEREEDGLETSCSDLEPGSSDYVPKSVGDMSTVVLAGDQNRSRCHLITYPELSSRFTFVFPCFYFFMETEGKYSTIAESRVKWIRI